MNILIINAGSSSLKYQLMDPDTGVVSAKGLCERIYIDGRLTHKTGDKKVTKDIPMPTHSEAIAAVLDILVDPEYGVIKSVDEIDAVGHRVLHGGMEFSDSCIVDDQVIKAIEKCIPLGPPAQPRQPDGHPCLPGGHAQDSPGRRVRHRLPHDHAPQGLPVRHSQGVL